MKKRSWGKIKHFYRKQLYAYWWRGKSLPQIYKGEWEVQLAGLNAAILSKNQQLASEYVESLEQFSQTHVKKSFSWSIIELVVALLVAFLVAVVIRQMWFEPYEIPTGSMRPTFREKDRLVVGKTAFGLNIPLNTGHFIFEEKDVQRTGIVIWSGTGVDLPQTEDRLFGILPYTKRYVKRLIGKPGDTLYFYGGQVWGVDKNGEELTTLREAPWMQNLTYFPFADFEGNSRSTSFTENGRETVVLKQFNQPFAKVQFSTSGQVSGQLLRDKEWVDENPSKDLYFGQLYGMENYAKVRLLTPAEAATLLTKEDKKKDEAALAYLQIFHDPSLTGPRPSLYRRMDRQKFVQLVPEESLMPLHAYHLQALRDSLYTARFVVDEGIGFRYGVDGERIDRSFGIPLKGVPSGTYEFYDGQLYQVGFGGILTVLPPDHPLQPSTTERLIQLFNFGIEWNTLFGSDQPKQPLFLPSRYAYFRSGSFYVDRGPIAEVGDPVLTAFVSDEQHKASQKHDYRPFVDHGVPSKEKILSLGVHVPEKSYVVLGDNPAMSADSRTFGFLPEANLEGRPTWLFWPIQERFGLLPQPSIPWINLPLAIVLTVFLLVVAVVYTYNRWLTYSRFQPR